MSVTATANKVIGAHYSLGSNYSGRVSTITVCVQGRLDEATIKGALQRCDVPPAWFEANVTVILDPAASAFLNEAGDAATELTNITVFYTIPETGNWHQDTESRDRLNHAKDRMVRRLQA